MENISSYDKKFKRYEKRNYIYNIESSYKEILSRDKLTNKEINNFIDYCYRISERYYFGNTDLKNGKGRVKLNKYKLEHTFPIWIQEFRDFIEWRKDLLCRAKIYYKVNNVGYIAQLWLVEEEVRLLLKLVDFRKAFYSYTVLLDAYIRIVYGLIKVLYINKEINDSWVKEFTYLISGIVKDWWFPKLGAFSIIDTEEEDSTKDLKEFRKRNDEVIENIKQEIIAGKLFYRLSSKDIHDLLGIDLEDYRNILQAVVKREWECKDMFNGKVETEKISNRIIKVWDNNHDRRELYKASFKGISKKEEIENEAIDVAKLVKEFDTLPYETLAKKMGVSLSTFKRRVKKAKDMGSL
jgi:DNA-binding Lrp family transcriptional regulator